MVLDSEESEEKTAEVMARVAREVWERYTAEGVDQTIKQIEYTE